MTEVEKFNKEKHYKSIDVKCCLTCEHARRWAFESRYSEDPSDLSAMCLHPDAPHEPISFGGTTERKYVTPFNICECYKKDKNIK